MLLYARVCVLVCVIKRVWFVSGCFSGYLTEIEAVLNSRRYVEFQEAFLVVSQPDCFSSFTLGRFPPPHKKEKGEEKGSAT